MIGVNNSGWFPWAVTPAGEAMLSTLGVGTQQFPNAPWIYNWHTNESLNDPASGVWYKIPVSIAQWAASLSATHAQGLYILPYGYDPAGTGPETIADVQDLVRTIVANHWPINALVIGSEEFGGWTDAEDLWPSHSALEYATVAKSMALAIHAIDPAMMVGVDFAMPWSITAGSGGDAAWNQTVLRIDGPYVNFLSVHYYPVPQVLTNTALLKVLPVLIRQGMSYVEADEREYISAAGPVPQIWVTEFNPYAVPSAQTTEAVYGPALVESYLAFIADGAAQVDFWSLYGSPVASQPVGGDNHQPGPAPTDAKIFSVTGLASDGTAPEPPAQSLYPSGQAVAQLTQVIGQGGTLQVDPGLFTTSGVYGAVIRSGATDHWVLVNTNNRRVTVHLGGTPQQLAATSLTMVAAGQAATPQAPPVVPTPTVTGAVYDPMLGTVTVTGRNLGPVPTTVSACGAGVDQPTLSITDVTTSTQYGWESPGQGRNCYGITISQWTSSRIVAVLDGPHPAAGDQVSIAWWQGFAGWDVVTQNATAVTEYPSWWQTTAHIAAVTYDAGSQQLVVTGTGFGTAPPLEPAPAGGQDQEVLEVTNLATHESWGLHLGHVQNYYGFTAMTWSPTTITIQLYGPPGGTPDMQVTWMPSGQSVSEAGSGPS